MKKVLVLFVLLVMCLGVFAQEDDITIDEAYLRQAQKIMVIQSMAYQNDSDSKNEAISNIRDLIADGTFDSDNTTIIKVLMDMGMEGTARIFMENGSPTNYYTDVRINAAKALGEIGGEHAVNALVAIMRVDDEPAVLTEAVRGIAENIENGDITTQLVIADAVYSQTAINKDNRFANEFLEAVEMMVDNDVEIADVIIDEVVKIANRRNGYNSSVSAKAKDVLVNILF
ncbi:MAG: HEAT repeat domain-containing protein [Spirochaetaceae bacterium]|jgi:hypothetical protein|nr:HEAT repeat domain-containing protein [Spirochaetaceae bacterium]